jgi:hypothetical protein
MNCFVALLFTSKQADSPKATMNHNMLQISLLIAALQASLSHLSQLL